MTTRRCWRRAVALVATLVAGAGLVLGPSSAASAGDVAGYQFANANSGMVLDVAGGAVDNGAGVIQWPANGGDNQRWAPLPLDDGSFVLVNLNSYEVLDVAGASTDNGAPVIQWEWNGGANQLWRQYAVGPDLVVFINEGSGLALDVGGGSIDAGAGVIQWPWNGGANQLWQGLVVNSVAAAGAN